LKKMRQFYPKDIRGIDPRVLEAFRHYPWPGNIRELENLMERAYILETSHVLSPESFPRELFVGGPFSAAPPVDASCTLAEVRRKGIEHIERNYLKELLTRNEGRIKASAESAGVTTRQLHKLLAKYGIRKEDYKPSPVYTQRPEP
jgi:DNA-binding NtrC family response regulator